YGQSSFTGTFGDCLHTAVVGVATTVEDDGFDTGVLGTLGHQFAHLAGLAGLVAFECPQIGFHGGGRDQGLADGVVDDLDEDVARGASHREARALGRSAHVLAQRSLTTLASNCTAVAVAFLYAKGHLYLPAFLILLRTISPAWRTPLPLYDSGRRIFRMFAAVSPTSRLAIP